MRRDVFQAIADPTRREIIELLADNTLSINAIARKFDISRPAISKHLKILNECEIIEFTKDGRERFCHIKPEKLIPAFLWIEKHKELWENRIDSFESYIAKLEFKSDSDE